MPPRAARTPRRRSPGGLELEADGEDAEDEEDVELEENEVDAEEDVRRLGL